jgi:hypothetical protein
MTLYTTVEAYGAFPQPSENCPVSELDPYSDEALIDPGLLMENCNDIECLLSRAMIASCGLSKM